MFKNLNIIEIASSMARHAAHRHSVIAENIANADTPGYKAKDVEAFAEAYKRSQNRNLDSAADMQFRTETLRTAESPNGNSVSLEDQMWRSSSTKRDHETAITIYTKALTMLRTSLGGGGR